MVTVAFGDVSANPYYASAGTTVQITGDNMAANEAVTVDVAYPDGSLAQEHSVAADANGNFADSYTIKDTDPAGIFTVKATGQSSGTVFTTTFDPGPAHVYFATSGLPASTSVAVSVTNYTNSGGQANRSTTVTFNSPGGSSDSNALLDVAPSTSVAFSFPATLTPTGKTCTFQSASPSSPYTSSTSGSTSTITGTYTCVDNAPPDTTPPVITKVITGTVGLHGWYTSDVSVAWTVTDPESAVVIDSGCGTQNFTSETTAVTSSCSAHSEGGSSSDSVTLKIHKSPRRRPWRSRPGRPGRTAGTRAMSRSTRLEPTASATRRPALLISLRRRRRPGRCSTVRAPTMQG